MTIVIVSFFAIFAVVLIAVSVGLSAMEAQRKKKVVGMLETVAGKSPEAETTVLKDAGGAREDFLTRLATSLNISTKMQTQIQQAGMDWSVGKLLVAMGIGAAVGVVLGMRFTVLMFPS